MKESVTSFVKKRTNRTYANASAITIKKSASRSFLRVKKAKTNSIAHAPSMAKNSIDGKICLCSTSRVIDKIEER